MKIQCDVCNKEEAAVFCTADEAALCDGCDRGVHHANKLASKHLRFSLHVPSTPKSFPLCDVCQEKRGFLFCQQDRAILCQDCDVPIHTANEFTKQHSRFLLTGVKLSSTSALYTSPASSATASTGSLVPCTTTTTAKSRPPPPQPTLPQPAKKPVSLLTKPAPNSIAKTSYSANNNEAIKFGGNSTNNNINSGSNNMLVAGEGFGSLATSSISEYLIETLPGWHVEDFLENTSTPFGFCKPDDHEALTPFMASENQVSSFSSESSGIWVPQAPPTPHQYPSLQNQQHYQQIGMQSGFNYKETKDQNQNQVGNLKTNSRRWTMEDVFTVPQISPQPNGSKRSRMLW
ncbi:unnamed protein product [Linum tenue]|uniref:B box-type domain-containing protein n=1 Tax=Linum tenue TaxID=586396 RepID=A0AAV0HFG4_9ROSI|nr:unnamed protein product [Linum tenue]